jgi:hypothetical protein
MSTLITVPMGSKVSKHPSAEKVYQVLWDRFLNAGQTVSGVSVAIHGPDNVLTYDNATHDGASTTQVRLKAGTNGATYIIEITITYGSSPTETETQWFEVYVHRGY